MGVNRHKSAVARPWSRTFLGDTFTTPSQAKLKVAPESVQRFKRRLRERLRRGRGRHLRRVLAELRPVRRGWVSYVRKSQVRSAFEELDRWIRRTLRCVLWRQWQRPRTRATERIRRGLPREWAWSAATKGRGPWWHAGAGHMNQAVPTRYLSQLGLVSLSQEAHRLERFI